MDPEFWKGVLAAVVAGVVLKLIDLISDLFTGGKH